MPTTPPWQLSRGANVTPAGTRFSLWAPRAERAVVHVLSGPAAGEHALVRGEGGVFEGEVAGVGADTDYAYALDSTPDRPDPVSRSQPRGVHGPSRVVDPTAFRWTDAAWTGLEMADLIIYELHVGTFSERGTFEAVIERLSELRELGVTAIELMPVAQFPGERNWGYDGVQLYAPQNSYGGPEGLKRLVNAAHGAGLAVILDVVYNHLGPEGNYLGFYGPYFSERYRTPWGLAINYDGPDSDEVRHYFIDNALYWITEFHVDALRLDAVHGIYDFGARHVLAELADRVHEQAARLRRRVQVIAESDLNDPKLVRSPDCGGYGLDAQWSDDFHHAVHVALTGEHSGYYADYQGVADIAKALERRFVHDGTYAVFRRRRHGAPATDVPADRFVVFIQNHDQVGNRATGERIATLVSPEQCKVAASLLLLSPYVPLLFMGEEYGETRPFLYFVSHTDAALVEAVRAGRRAEFEAFTWGEGVPDPQAEETFERSKLDRSAAARPEHQSLLTLYRDLLRLRHDEPALRPGEAKVTVHSDAEEGWIVLQSTPGLEGRGARGGRGGTLLAIFNLSSSERVVPVETSGRSCWHLRFSSRSARYGGPGDAPPTASPGADGTMQIIAPPHSAALYRHEDS
jgi:maltooligosyltrehalose trehalohydrolase